MDLRRGPVNAIFPSEEGRFGLSLANRAANRPFTHASELRLLQGFGGTVHATLAPHVCALPRCSLLNPNTATIPVLQSLNPRITEEVARRLWRDGRASWQDVSDFRQELLSLAIPFEAPQERGEAQHATLLCGDGCTVFPTSSRFRIDVLREAAQENGAAQGSLAPKCDAEQRDTGQPARYTSPPCSRNSFAFSAIPSASACSSPTPCSLA